MICPNCTAQLPDDAAFCGNCGSPVTASSADVPAAISAQPPVSPMEMAPVAQGGEQSGALGAVPQDAGELGMKWFKFIIYFQLFFAALTSLAGALNYFGLGVRIASSGMHQNAASIWFFVNGVFLVVWAIFAVLVRFRLSSFKSGAPRAYLVLLGVSVAVGVADVVWMMAWLGAATPPSDVVVPLVGNLVMLVLNFVYFRKRKHLFVS